MLNMSRNARLLSRKGVALSASLMAAVASPAMAANEVAAAPQSGLADIVVTAQKRAQSLQDVPIAITAVTEDFLDTRDIRSISQLENVAPNLRVLTSGLYTQISIRGSTATNPALTNDPTVGIYLDGIYIGKAQGSVFDITDLERVEVLRGPQGTLYGRNTLSGAISMVTRKPSGEFGGRLEASYGNYDYHRLRGSLDLPEAGIFSVKLSGSYQKRDGFYDVVPEATTNVDELNNSDSISGMIAVRARPSDALTVDYSFDISRNDITHHYYRPISVVSGSSFDEGGNSFPAYLYAEKERPSRVNIDAPSRDYAKVWGHGLTIAYELGDAELKSITGYRKLHYIGIQDSDGTPLPIFAADRRSHYRSFSEELQLTGQSGALNYTFGLYYFHDKGRTRDVQEAFGGYSLTTADYNFTGESYAAYGQVDFEASDRLTLTGGLRYTHESKEIDRYAVSNLAAAPVIDTSVTSIPKLKFNNVSPTLVANYEINSHTNIYAKFAKGFKSGGFNGETNSVAELRDPYAPEKIDAFEVGMKGRFFDGLLQLNLAGFWNEVNDLQLAVLRVVDGVTVGEVRNAAKARTRGIEIEAIAQPVPSLNLQASFSYTDPKYKEFIDNGVNVADNRSFNRLPKYTGFVSADWTVADASWGKLNWLADVNIVSDYYTAAFALRGATYQNANNSKVKGFATVNSRLVLSDIAIGNTSGEVSLWARNLLDRKAIDNYIDFGSSLGGLVTGNYIPPRTYGITVASKF